MNCIAQDKKGGVPSVLESKGLDEGFRGREWIGLHMISGKKFAYVSLSTLTGALGTVGDPVEYEVIGNEASAASY